MYSRSEWDALGATDTVPVSRRTLYNQRWKAKLAPEKRERERFDRNKYNRMRAKLCTIAGVLRQPVNQALIAFSRQRWQWRGPDNYHAGLIIGRKT